jgi:dienelactone hydrolase
MNRSFWGSMAVLLCSMNVDAQLQSESVEYQQGNTHLKGYGVCNPEVKGLRPGILVVHEWWGLNDYARSRADQLARLGYVALAADLYGDGKIAKDMQEAGALSSVLKGNRPLLRERARAGLEALRGNPRVDPKRVAAIGYCFGGTTVLELARSGADVAGVVSFHGGLDTPDPSASRNIRGRVLVLHGADDSFEPQDQILAFQDEMRKAGVDWQMHYYGGAVHSFTNPASGNDKARGVAYSESADHRSWEEMKRFLAELFQTP